MGLRVCWPAMQHSEHTMLVGEGATAFAKMMGMREEDLGTDDSRRMHQSWLDDACQPNYYKHFEKDEESCPPYASPKHGEHKCWSWVREDTEFAVAA